MSEEDFYIDEYGVRRASRASLARRTTDEHAFVSPRQEFAPPTPYYQQESAPRSAPSRTISFPDNVSGPPAPYVQTTTSWPLATANQSSYYTQPSNMSFSPVGDNPYDDWAYSSRPSQASSQQTFFTSTSSFSGASQPQSWGRPQAMARLSRPISTMHPSYAQYQTSSPRRESEGVDEFTSPTDFALFAEATSSLDISPVPSPNPATTGVPRMVLPQQYSPAPYARQTMVISPSRLDAPLPPTPHLRSSSSPAQMMRRQPSRSQMLAEALTGIDLEDTRVGSSEDDDELPNYEQSQAEVNERKRVEAARRARELNEAWSRARRRGPPA